MDSTTFVSSVRETLARLTQISRMRARILDETAPFYDSDERVHLREMAILWRVELENIADQVEMLHSTDLIDPSPAALGARHEVAWVRNHWSEFEAYPAWLEERLNRPQ